MGRRAWLIGGATALALVVLLVSLLAGPADLAQEGPVGPPPDPTDVNPEFDPAPALGDGDLPRERPFEAVERGGYSIVEGDRHTVLTWEKLTARPQGVSDVTQPVARVFFTPTRVLEIRADEGTLIAPENHPQEGDLRGHVVITLFESRDDEPVRFDDDHDVQLRAYLDEATFNLELGHVESQSPVHVTGPRVDFRGRGLSLTFNQLRKRIEYLEVFEGKWLRFKPGDAGDPTDPARPGEARSAGREAAGGSTSSATATTQPEPGDRGATAVARAATQPESTGAAGPTGGAGASTQSAEDEGHQFYRARFENAVHVVVAEGELDMTAEALEAVFSLDAEAAERGTVNDRPAGDAVPTPPTSRRDPVAPEAVALRAHARPAAVVPVAVVHVVSGMLATLDDAGADAPLGSIASTDTHNTPTLAPPGPDDVVITWTGRLIMRPETNPPADLAGPDDALLELHGSASAPAVARTIDQETITGSRIQYLASRARLAADGSDLTPLRVESPRLGTLTGTHLTIDQATGTGHVLGPGTLHAYTTPQDNAQPDTKPDTPSTQPATTTAPTAPTTQPADSKSEIRDSKSEILTITWTDRLDLAFYLRSDADAAPAATTAFGTFGRADRTDGLRAATFRGDVRANHPEFDLAADQLHVALDRPTRGSDDAAGETDDPVLRTIEATGRVKAVAPGRTPDEPLTIAADALTIYLAPTAGAGGDVQPRRLLARSNVTAEQPGLHLQSQRLDVTFTDDRARLTSASAQAAAEPRSEGATSLLTRDASAIQRLVAEQQVHVTLDDPAVELIGHRLIAEPGTDQLELLGRKDEPARVIQPDATLSGPRIVMQESTQAVHVVGPGWLDVQMDRADPTARLNATWQEALHFDDNHGMAHFLGNVRVMTEEPTARTRLACDDLRLELARVDEERGDAVAPEADGDTDAGALEAARARRQIRFATARGHVLFTAEGLDEDAAGAPPTRLRLEGPLMTFDGQTERVQVIGAGRMLIEDRRPAEAKADADAGAQRGPLLGVSFTGRGATLFLWKEQLTLDAQRNDMRIEGTVQMIHRPVGRDRVLQLDAQHLLADLEQTGGLGLWRQRDADGDAPQPQVVRIEADDKVRIIDAGRTITADHLRYVAADQLVLLWADTGGLVRVTRADQPTAFTAEQVRWDLARDRLEATRLGPGIVPLRQ